MFSQDQRFVARIYCPKMDIQCKDSFYQKIFCILTANLVIPVCVVTSSNPSTSITQEEVMEVREKNCRPVTCPDYNPLRSNEQLPSASECSCAPCDRSHILYISNSSDALKNRPLRPFCARKDGLL